MQLIVTLLVLCFTALAQDTVRSTTNGWIESSPILPFENETITMQAAGRVRTLGSIAEDKLELHRDLDGKYVIVMRVAVPGAAAVRVHFDEFRLPGGARLLLYGWSPERGVSRVLGYQEAGPLKSGEFWTRAVPGSQAVIELHLDQPIEMLPFHMSAVAALDGIEESALPLGQDGEPVSSETHRAMFRGTPVEYKIVDGMAVWEGDILLGRPEELEPVRKEYERSAGGIGGTQYRWPNGTIPYTIDSAMPNQSRVTAAISHWNTQLAGHLQLVPRTTETAYINFKVAAPYTCSSYVGYYRYAGQPVNIGDYCGIGNIIHEIGHVVGLYHEHTRSDRDSYVTLQLANADPNSLTNFNIISNSLNPTPYDYGSIMHYGAYAFSINSQPTILTIPAGISIGQRSGLSANDVAGVKVMYPAAVTAPSPSPSPAPAPSPTQPPVVTPSPVRISIVSNPAGRPVIVDGARVTAPANFDWLPGSQHTVAAGASEVVAGTRYTFLGWSDGGQASRTYTVPSTATTLTETYKVDHLLTTSASTGGSVFVTPVSVDGYYPAGSSLTVSARPADAYCLSSWSGLLPVTGLTLNVQMTRPIAVGATFATGSLTVSPWVINAAQAGGTYTAGLTTGSACAWSVASRTSWIVVETAAAGSGSTTIRLRVAPNTTGRARAGIVIISQRAMIVRQQ